MNTTLTDKKKKIIFIFILSMVGLFSTSLQAQNLQLSFLDSYSYTDTIHVPIMMDSVVSVGAITAGIQFDTVELEFIEVTNAANTPNTIYYNLQGDKMTLAWFTLNPIVQSDTFGILTFRRKKTLCNSFIQWRTINNQAVSDATGNIINTHYYDGYAHFIKAETPILETPIDYSSNVPINSYFRWAGDHLSCVEGYQLQIATDTNFTQLAVDSTLSDTAMLVSSLQELTAYYWRSGKIDAAGNIYWSAHRPFTTQTLDTIQVQIPTIYTFSDTVIVSVTLENSENMGQFQLAFDYDTTALGFIGMQNTMTQPSNIIYNDSSYGRIEITWQTNDVPFVFPSDTLLELHFYKKIACDGAITWDTSGTWGKFYFSEHVELPIHFTDGQVIFLDTTFTNLNFPLDSSENVFIRPELNWDSVSCTEMYQLQLAYDNNFTTLHLDTLLLDTTFIPTDLLADTVYYWRVGRFNVVDSLYWSDTWPFRTEQVLPVFLKLNDIITESDTFSIPVVLDSLENAIAFELVLEYDTAVIQLLTSFDTTDLLDILNIEDQNGSIKITWQSLDSTLEKTAQIPSDTLIQLQFIQLSDCFTRIEWNTDSSDFYHINEMVNIDAVFQNSNIYFLEKDSPEQITPVDSANTLLHTELFWQPTPCVVQYHLQVALDSQFTQIVLDTIQNDTANWLTQLQANTQYFWRVAKEDLVGDLYWSDTLRFQTGDSYLTSLSIQNITTYDSLVSTSLTIDSSFYTTGFQLILNYNQQELEYLSYSNPIFNDMQIINAGGVLVFLWQDTLTPRFIEQSILADLQFKKINACITPLTWNSSLSTIDFRGNANLSTIQYHDATFEFLNTQSPNLQLPFDNQTNLSPSVDFNWQNTDCFVNYQFQIARNSNFTNIIIDSLNVVDTFINQIELNHGTTYYWRVGRWDTQNDRYWSDTFQLTTQALPVVTLEVENVISYSDTLVVPVLIEDVVNTRAFQVAFEFDTLAFQFLDIINPLVNIQTSIDSQVVVNWSGIDKNINADTLFQIRFLQISKCYSDIIIDSTHTYFQYRDSLVPTVIDTYDGSMLWVNDEHSTLAFPPNDTTFLTLDFNFEWNAILCAESYHLQVATDSNFTNIVVDEFNINTTSFAAFNLDFNQKYYWKISQEDSQGNEHWSEIWNFKTDRTDNQDYRIYPNPTSGEVRFWFAQSSNASANITVFNSIGQLMLQTEIAQRGKSFILDLTRFNNGIYMVQYDDGNTQWVEKVIVFK